MKYDMILAGVGGQGVLSMAAIIGVAAVARGLHMKQAEVHGMSQRGGAVQSHLRLSDRPIYSDLIPDGAADMVLSMEPMETLRYMPYLAAQGVLIVECAPVVNITDYPAMDDVIAALKVYPRVHLVEGEQMAKELRAPRAGNMVLLGAASPFLPLSAADLEGAITSIFGRKGEKVVAQNIEAFRRGREVVG